MDHTVPLDKHQGSDSKSAEKKTNTSERRHRRFKSTTDYSVVVFLIALVAFILEMSAFDS